MARRLQPRQNDKLPLSRAEVDELFANSGAAIEALEVALANLEGAHDAADVTAAELGARLAHRARLDVRLRKSLNWMVAVFWPSEAGAEQDRTASVRLLPKEQSGQALGRWFRFFIRRNVLQRAARIVVLLANRIDRATSGAEDALAQSAAHLEVAKRNVAVAQAHLRRTDIPKVVQAGRDAHARADRLREVIELLGDLTSADCDTSITDCERYYAEFEELLGKEYRAFASRENYPKEADAFAQLQKIFAHLGELRLAPRLARRNICAVAGGFSSGKSSFLNALIGKTMLPVKVTPTTSIPTYIFHVDDALSINAFNHCGGGVEIKPDALKQMTHNFKNQYGIELQRLVHRVSIYTPDLSQWGNLALIDTPGYDADKRDEDVALANVLRASFLIWVVDCNKGTLPAQDIHLIRKFINERPEDKEKKLYLVLNMGDTKSEQERKDIMNFTANTAKAASIPFAGIGIYSSRDREWYAHQGSSFEAFLQTVDQAQSSSTSGLEQDVEAIFQSYIDYHEQEAKQLGNALGLLKRLDQVLHELDKVLHRNYGDLNKLTADLTERRNYIRKMQKEHESLRDEAEQLQKRFAAAVRGFVESIGTAASYR